MTIDIPTLYVMILSTGLLFAVGVSMWPNLEPIMNSTLGFTTMNLLFVVGVVLSPVILFLMLRMTGVFNTKTEGQK